MYAHDTWSSAWIFEFMYQLSTSEFPKIAIDRDGADKYKNPVPVALCVVNFRFTSRIRMWFPYNVQHASYGLRSSLFFCFSHFYKLFATPFHPVWKTTPFYNSAHKKLFLLRSDNAKIFKFYLPIKVWFFNFILYVDHVYLLTTHTSVLHFGHSPVNARKCRRINEPDTKNPFVLWQ